MLMIGMMFTWQVLDVHDVPIKALGFPSFEAPSEDGQWRCAPFLQPMLGVSFSSQSFAFHIRKAKTTQSCEWLLAEFHQQKLMAEYCCCMTFPPWMSYGKPAVSFCKFWPQRVFLQTPFSQAPLAPQAKKAPTTLFSLAHMAVNSWGDTWITIWKVSEEIHLCSIVHLQQKDWLEQKIREITWNHPVHWSCFRCLPQWKDRCFSLFL